MSVYPNKFCIGFCNWMLNTSWQQLTPPRLNLINTIYAAAVAGTTVSDNEYNNFIQTTSWRQPFYLSYLDNSLPFSLPPIGTCDFWLSAAGLRINATNAYGITEFNGSISKASDLNGGAVFGANAVLSRQPNPIVLDNQLYQPRAFSFNGTALQNLILTNAAALTQNKTGYTLFVVSNFGTVGTSRFAIYFSAGATGSKSRIGIAVNSAGNWSGQAVRLDADVQATFNGTAASGTPQIICLTVSYSTGVAVLYANGIVMNTAPALVSTGSTSNVASSTVAVGAINQSNPWNGQLTDALAFQTALSAADVLTVTEWLNALRSIY